MVHLALPRNSTCSGSSSFTSIALVVLFITSSPSSTNKTIQMYSFY